MKNIITKSLLISLIFLFNKFSYSQVTFEAAVSNQVVNGNEVSFDIYLQSAGAEALYLGHADFVLYYNAVNFTAPVFEYVDGSCDLRSSNGTSTMSYNDNIITDPSFVEKGQLVININMPVFSNSAQFNSRIAKIDNVPGVYKLGTFKITGISNSSGTLGLEWKTLPSGVRSTVQTLSNTDPWISSTAAGSYFAPGDEPLPVSVSYFTARAEKNIVSLSWQTEWEENNARFEIQRREPETGPWITVGTVAGSGTVLETRSYSFQDRNLTSGKYEYKLVAIDYNGNTTTDNDVTANVEIGAPVTFVLSQNYPNPFNPVTSISFEIPVEGLAKLVVYDMSGREAGTLLNEVMVPGYYTVDFNGANLSSGVYFYRMIANTLVITKKMVLMK